MATEDVSTLLTLLARRPTSAWRRDATCRRIGSGLFYADDPAARAQALRICRNCPVRVDCLVDSLRWPANEQFGVVGGVGARGRRRLRQAVTAQAKACGTQLISYRPSVADRVVQLSHLPVRVIADELGIDRAIAYRIIRTAS